jgi:hypothetical protein
VLSPKSSAFGNHGRKERLRASRMRVMKIGLAALAGIPAPVTALIRGICSIPMLAVF